MQPGKSFLQPETKNGFPGHAWKVLKIIFEVNEPAPKSPAARKCFIGRKSGRPVPISRQSLPQSTKACAQVVLGLRSVMVGIKTCQYRSMGRQSPGGSGNCILEQQAITRKSLEVGTGGPCISVDRKMIGSQGIDHNQ